MSENFDPKIADTNSYMLVNDMHFYSDLLSSCVIEEMEDNNPKGIKTVGAYVSKKGFTIGYTKGWADSMSQEQINYAMLHELMHLISNHGARSIGYEKKMADLSADQLIDSSIEEYYDGKQSRYLVAPPAEDRPLIPEKFKDIRTLDQLYSYNIENIDPPPSDGDGDGDGDGGGDSGGGFDQHPEDDVSPEMRESMVNDFIEQQRNRGHITNNVENFLDKLKKSDKNYMNMIKGALSQMMGKLKKQTWNRFTRKDPEENMLKGFKKHNKVLNVILDTSGSMGNDFGKVLSYIFYNGININLIQCDTEVKAAEKVNSKKKVQELKIKGLGGTTISPAFNYVRDNYNENPTILLTDGYTDDLDLSGIRHEVLILSTEKECSIRNSNVRVRQFLIPKESN